jgi:FtsZ-interacting cell division protein YlmF
LSVSGSTERVITLGSDASSEQVRVVLSRLQQYAEVPEVVALLAEHPAAKRHE